MKTTEPTTHCPNKGCGKHLTTCGKYAICIECGEKGKAKLFPKIPAAVTRPKACPIPNLEMSVLEKPWTTTKLYCLERQDGIFGRVKRETNGAGYSSKPIKGLLANLGGKLVQLLRNPVIENVLEANTGLAIPAPPEAEAQTPEEQPA